MTDVFLIYMIINITYIDIFWVKLLLHKKNITDIFEYGYAKLF